MKNNNILILLISTLGVGILCAIVASIAFTYYNGGFDELTKNDTTTTLQAVAVENQPSGLDASALLESAQKAASGSSSTYVSLVSLMQKYQTCNTSMIVLQTSMINVQFDDTVLEYGGYGEEIQGYVEDVETNCSGLSDNAEVADIYPDVNKEFGKAEKFINEMIENYQDYFTYKKTKYLDKADAAYEDAMDKMQSAFDMLQQAMVDETP